MQWLHDEGLIPALLAQMNPHVEPEVSVQKIAIPAYSS